MRFILILLISISLNALDMKVGYGTASMDQYNKKDTMIAMSIWIDEILKDSNNTASFTFYDDPREMAKDLSKAKVDLVIDYGIEFVMHSDLSILDDGFTGGMLNAEDQHLVLVLPKKQDLESFYSMKNPIIAMQKRERLSEIYIRTLFLENTKKDKIEILKTSKRSGALLKVFFKQADAALVTKKTFDFAVELNPQIGKRLKIAKYSKISAGSFGFFRKGYNKDSQDELIDIALNVVDTKRGAQLLTLFQTDTVLTTKVKDLDPLRELYKKYLDLKGKN